MIKPPRRLSAALGDGGLADGLRPPAPGEGDCGGGPDSRAAKL